MTADPAKPRTARHFDEGDRVVHTQYGVGVIEVDSYGRKYPMFEAACGTAMTRVLPAADAHPATITVDGLRYTRADDVPGLDSDERAYVHLGTAGDPDDFREGIDPLARLVFRDGRGIKPARWSYVPTGDVDVDPESGYPAPAYVWALADGRTSPNDETTAVLDAALRDVGDQYERFVAADRAMGDPYP